MKEVKNLCLSRAKLWGDDESVAATSGAENSGETSSDEGAEKDSTDQFV
jgi:hypothetical protein